LSSARTPGGASAHSTLVLLDGENVRSQPGVHDRRSAAPWRSRSRSAGGRSQRRRSRRSPRERTLPAAAPQGVPSAPPSSVVVVARLQRRGSGVGESRTSFVRARQPSSNGPVPGAGRAGASSGLVRLRHLVVYPSSTGPGPCAVPLTSRQLPARPSESPCPCCTDWRAREALAGCSLARHCASLRSLSTRSSTHATRGVRHERKSAGQGTIAEPPALAVAESVRFELTRALPPYGHSKTAP
jgi:hypothetical protein